MSDPCPCGVTLPADRTRARGARPTDSGCRTAPGSAGIASTRSSTRCTPPCARSQIDQAADYSVTLRCVLTDDPGARSAVEGVVEELRHKLGHAVPVRPEFVAAIPHEGGKIRYIRTAVVDA